MPPDTELTKPSSQSDLDVISQTTSFPLQSLSVIAIVSVVLGIAVTSLGLEKRNSMAARKRSSKASRKKNSCLSFL